MRGALAVCLKASHFATDYTKVQEWPQLFLLRKKQKQSICVRVNKPKTHLFATDHINNQKNFLYCKTLKSNVLNLGFCFFNIWNWGLLPTARFALPEGAVSETTFIFLIVSFSLNSNSWIFGVSSEIEFRVIFCALSCLLKWYSGPFLLLPPVSKSVWTDVFFFDLRQ